MDTIRETNVLWQFVETDPATLATGTFRAWGAASIDRLYFPLANEAGMRSWVSPRLHGSPALSHHEYLSLPLTAEDLPHTLLHRDVWLTEQGRRPFSLSSLSPEGLTPLTRARQATWRWIEAGVGWWSLTRCDPQRRVALTATLWCPADVDEPLELMQITVKNTTSRPLRFVPYAAIPLFGRSADNVRDHRHVTVLLHRVQRLRHGVRLQPTMSFDERGHRLNATQYAVLAFGPHGAAPTDVWPLERDFLGEGGTFAAPQAVWKRQRAPAAHQLLEAAGREAIGGFRFAPCALAPGATASYWLVCGICRDPQRPRRWMRWAKRSRAIERSLERTKTFWRNRAQRIAFLTPDRPLNHWLCWVTVQPIFRRLYGNSYLPQFDYGRGGRGWRDLWQDSLALLLDNPAGARPMLLRNMGGARIDGSNATIIAQDGSFLADRNDIPRAWMDHGVWPVHTVLRYLDQTGDADILFEPQTYFRDPQVFRCRRWDARWSAAEGLRLRTRRGRLYRGSVLEHLLVQTLTAFFNVGEHNCCRLEGADWNDGLDMASQRGESVAFSAYYAWNLKRLAHLARWLAARGLRAIEVCEELRLLLDRLPGQRPVDYRRVAAKRRRLEQYLAAVARDLSGGRVRIPLETLAHDLMQKSEDLSRRIQRQEWIDAQGERFFNGYYDNRGRRVEGDHPLGVRMTLTGQVFPVMAGIATEEQVAHVIRAVNRWLRDPRTGGIRLNTDFGAPQPHLGRAFFFAYGDKENGAVFSHMAVMYAAALYARRRAEEGRAVWEALYRLATDQPRARIFPGLPEYFNREGRGMYGYLTGSASWLVSLLLTQVFGIRGKWGALVIDPQLTLEDFGAGGASAVETRFAGRYLQVRIANPQHLRPSEYRVTEVRMDGRTLPLYQRPEGGVHIERAVIERLAAHRRHLVHVTLGRGRAASEY